MLIEYVKEHLVRKRCHPLFRVWKDLRPTDECDEEWVEHAWRSGFNEGVPMDEGVHMDTMLQHLGQPPLMDMPQPTEQQLRRVPMDEDVHMETMSKNLR